MLNRGLWLTGLVLGAAVVSATPRFTFADDASEITALKERLAKLEKNETENWLTDERKNEIKALVKEVIDDAKSREGSAGTVTAGYKDGFYITDGTNFKLVVGGFIQARYAYARSNEPFTSRQVSTAGGGNPAVTPNGPGDAQGFDIRRARVSFSGFVVNPNLTYKFEGDFEGGSSGSGAFTMTDVFIAYKFNDWLHAKLGSFKAPFAKAELTSDTAIGFMERSETLAPFDPVRVMGLSMFGDIVPDQLGYDINVNNGSKSNLLKGVDSYATSSGGAKPTANLDNRLAFYARLQWAGAGKISEFNDESDLRAGDRPFIWMLGTAVGYESQNSTNNAFPSPQSSAASAGQSSASSGFIGNQTLNGDMFRGTVDWSAKVAGWSINTAAYFQQFNYNPGATSAANGSTQSIGGGYGTTDSSFFQWGGYGQVGYMVTDKWELTARAGMLATEGYANIGEFYSIGTNYYFAKHNAKIQADVTYTPEAAYTDSSTSIIQNTHDIIFRVQLQIKF